jgi:hypothetical protein
MKKKKRTISYKDRPRVVELLKHFHRLGYSLTQCSHPLRLGRTPEDLLPLAREAGVVFADQIEVARKARGSA